MKNNLRFYNLISELKLLTSDATYRNNQIREYQAIDQELSQYNASERTAQLMIEYLSQKKETPYAGSSL